MGVVILKAASTLRLLVFCFFFSDSENVLELNVFFQELSYELIEQQPAYDRESLLGKYLASFLPVNKALSGSIGRSVLFLVVFVDVLTYTQKWLAQIVPHPDGILYGNV